MKRNKRAYSITQAGSAIFMMFVLFWLTVSIPFVAASKDQMSCKLKKDNPRLPLSSTEEDTSNPLDGATEEKAPSTSSLTEEYLHDSFIIDFFSTTTSQDYKCEDVSTYISFHGELIVPPPDAA